jgi:c-di-GMP-binding flagellar brake protein YcgR
MATEDRRAFKRFEVLLKITYYLYSAPYPKEGLLVDVSRRGACIKIQKEINLSAGGTILLEILTPDLKTLNIKGEIVWFKQSEDGYIVGIKFNKLLDDASFRSIT